jgi:hypothetical protein
MGLAAKKSVPRYGFPDDLTDDFVRILWMGLGGRSADLDQYLRRVLPKWAKDAPELARRAKELLAQSHSPSGGPTRRAPGAEGRSEFSFAGAATAPMNAEEFMRLEMPVSMPIEPVWSPAVAAELRSIIQERRSAAELAKAGLRPTHTVIFTGLPGVGKTLAARWLARELGLPLAILNLGAVMSSFLGRTGANLRQVIGYASQQPCVLLLDELDAIAKRRDDNSDIGELKRLVTVLLQELDAWPSDALLIAATNHEQLIDPAVWRRFERRVVFPLPRADDQSELLSRLLGESWRVLASGTRGAIATAATHLSPADITQLALRTKREVIVSGTEFEPCLIANVSGAVSSLPLNARRRIGLELKRMKLGQREINRLTGLARETIREMAAK